MYKITVESSFSAAHHLVNYKGNCENVHGHNWRVLVAAGYENVSDDGIAIDFRELKKALESILEHLDHKDLNNIEYFNENPTSERIAEYIFRKIREQDIPVKNVKVFETDSYCAEYSED